MTFSVNVLTTKFLGFFLVLSGEGEASFAVQHIERSLTPFGWAAVIILPIALIFGIIYLTAEVLKKTKLK